MTLRLKLFAIVAVAAVALVTVAVSSGLSETAVGAKVESIRTSYLPKIRLRPQLQRGLDQLVRTIQSAVEAGDADLLAPAGKQRDDLLAGVADTGQTLTAGQVATLRLTIDDYYDSAIATSRRLITGTGGESTPAAVQDMQAKRTRVEAMIDQATAFDERELSAAFDAAAAEQRSASRVRVVAAVVCLALLFALSLWIGAPLLANVRALVAGFQRFGRNDFARPIVSTTRDELADVAARANDMAAQLRELDAERSREEWIRNGLAGLDDELRGDPTPREVADRTIAFLARYLDAPVGALYHGAPGGPFVLLGGHALPAGVAPSSFTVGEGLVGQAATRSALTVIDGEAGSVALRSGLVETAPRALAFAPLDRGAGVSGIVELALVRPLRDADRVLLARAGRTIAIALDSAVSRAETKALLEQTRDQAAALEHAGKALEQRAVDLARASAYKSQFLASMSHELRTPLNAIIGFSELLYDEAISLDRETSHEYLGDILTSGRHLLQLINDVLDLAKVEAGKLELHPEPIELTKVVGEVLAVLRSLTTKQNITIATDIAPEVDRLLLDPARLKQVLYNYLSNALKFTPERGTVVVRALPEGSDRVRLEVVDSGIGIPPEQIGRLFGDYEQTAAGAKKAGGTGLGLALTKRLVEAQGGVVGVRSEVGKGSTFYATLPRRAPGNVLAPVVTQVLEAGPGAPTILVVEDDPRDRAQLVLALSEAGYSVEAVSTGEEAIARCQSRTYDAITLDLLLPDMTGLDVLPKVRATSNGKVPVIIVTVVAEPGAVAGFAVHDILGKPFSEQALLSSLERAGVMPTTAPTAVLVIDDDPASLKVMGASLGKLGYLAVCEQDPVRGLEMASEERPAAIILDLLMPGMTGFEFLDRWRALDAARGVPIIVWTSKDLTAEEHGRLRRSAHAVVSKGHDGNARVVAELGAVLPGRIARPS